MLNLIEKAKTTHSLTKEELVLLLKNNDINEELFKAADEVRDKYLGNFVHLRGLIEFTNICQRNCMYCGLRRDNKNLKRYRLSEDEILDFAKKAVSYGYKTLVLQGGEDAYFTVERLTKIVKEIKALGVALTLSIGERSFEEYKILKETGADRFLLRIETTDKDLYEELDPGMSHDERKRCLSDLRKLGYEVGSGSLVGLPNQTIESLADDILFFKNLDADMIGIGPFIPNEDTPLSDAEGGNFTLSLKVMALTRLLLPDINIPATTAMETLDKNGRVIALQCGANVVMPNVTEGEYRKLYALYPGKICTGDTPSHCRGCITGKITKIGRVVSDGPGFRANGAEPKKR
ncbi:iron-only hydrogenase maturation protein HydE [Clostridium cavendishii DSM 21758]|uniref:Iron-only hydrogenase maturation protein HydE n=1 Tax=Clostridium cavendishii DSM 21758 TaxID=1121302 RepID=A0A1M6LRX1_9CLOT|nr:[FeFe] hydrogenase H-cluster radical SAM maturase HydE [Clostridium cavendishii]SHJ73911.1 iron-only hydrogenase maturation protein HydE [Clostridium cavendishii DSM 21758]